MSRRYHWTALFSHTGREIKDIYETIGIRPDIVYTDNKNVEQWRDNNIQYSFHHMPREEIYAMLEMERRQKRKQPLLVTLHGFMGIIPKHLVGSQSSQYPDEYYLSDLQIYNGHPGLINHYPELRGKDPQETTWNNIEKYAMIGSVVHKVTASIDDPSQIVNWAAVNNDCRSRKDLYNTLRMTSLLSWQRFHENYGRE